MPSNTPDHRSRALAPRPRRARLNAPCVARSPHARALPSACRAQGKSAQLKKPERAKPKRQAHGDQQKLRKGAHLVLKPKIAKAQAEERAQSALTKKIAARIEETMAARAGHDGGGLRVLKVDESGSVKPLRPGAAAVAKAKR